MSIVIAMVITLGTLTGCSKPPTLDAPTVHWGQDVCVACGMILTDPRYAGALITINHGEQQTFLFDDLGELLAWEIPAVEQSRRWVRDVQTQQWINADHAFYVRNMKIHTPMGTGIAAFSNNARAQSFSNTIANE